MHLDWFLEKHIEWGDILNNGGLIDFLYMGVKLGIYPSLSSAEKALEVFHIDSPWDDCYTALCLL